MKDSLINAMERAGLTAASPQPAPHAMTEERIAELGSKYGYYVEVPAYPEKSHLAFSDQKLTDFARALLAQPAAVEPAKLYPIGYVLTDANHLALLAENLLAYLDECSDADEGVIKPDESLGDHFSGIRSAIYEYRKRHQRYTDSISVAPSPAVAEPDRKAIDAQGAEGWQLVPKVSTDAMHQAYTKAKYDPNGQQPMTIPYLYAAMLSAAPSPLPAATLGKADTVRLIELLREIRPNYGDVGTRDVDVARQQKAIDEAITLLAQQPAASDVRDATRWREVAKGNPVEVHCTSRSGKPIFYFIGDRSDAVDFPEKYAEAIDNVIQSTPAVQADEGDKS